MAEHARERDKVAVDRSEGFGERLLGLLLDRAHEMPPQLIAPLIAEEVGRVGGRHVSVFLQDYEQLMLVPLPGRRLVAGEPEPIAGSPAGRAFLQAAPVEVPQADGVRLYLPLLDGSDQVGVMALTMDSPDDDDRRLLRRLAGLVADMMVTKDSYTDQFTRARRRGTMSVAAEIQWSLLPPLMMSVPQVEVAGILEPAYEVAGDSFDYALNDDILHVGVIDAMGHGLTAAVMATAAIGAYRHARRANVGLSETYAFMDRVIAEQFGPEHFVTAQMMRLNTTTGHLQWVNAGHPAPLLIRDHDVIRHLESATTLPVGFGGEEPRISEHMLRRGDRVLCFTDGIIEEHTAGGEQFGLEHLIDVVKRVGRDQTGVRAMVRALSHTLKGARGGVTSDDATVFLIEWRGGSAEHLVTVP
ncbi:MULTISPECIES: PP2C family protein-serine/threonine phosphatase [Streptomycetaceae]|uniref:Protein serine/threonine phosphatase n=1 Tax=Streptantibioticus cattleyicolor (strain ATCC 35852 / DSM 46488 / JCM 4925 / NBRC 14057 / NRRL 8057) TaxID=1003195 RepID=F8K3F9_STREN|nr:MULTISPECIES: PP2C family protein-serine/threonine phosphatase [Streptomycetaceae]AEW95078.1 protein serine/threonine phosphatase [Streptantibioticus cattleyicolor NRRL 8057 = DSM 46488]MYS59672.1 SpoIIE family protein phosphatase [Streptomyces sp. SID5468]CCB75427.1 Protein serine/threonine phosphatase [Streptantibioticus cattleyicolor NRRL 8057 = DSM 46488]